MNSKPLIRKWILTLLVLVCSAGMTSLYASDSSDAEMLRIRCEKEIKTLEVCVTNFGDAGDKTNFEQESKSVKLAKVRITQSKYK